MKTYSVGIILLIVAVSFPSKSVGQPAFQNLGFEAATIVSIPGDPFGRVALSSALPGWIGYAGAAQQDRVLYNETFVSSPGIGLLGNGWPFGGRIQGNFTAFLQPSEFGPNGPVDASLAQTAMIPATAESLRIYLVPHASERGFPIAGSPDGTFSISLEGQALSVVLLGSGPNNSLLYGADISAWAGQIAELRITAFAPTAALGGVNNLFLDSLQFSAVPVPEPSSLTVLPGVILAGVVCWRSYSRRQGIRATS